MPQHARHRWKGWRGLKGPEEHPPASQRKRAREHVRDNRPRDPKDSWRFLHAKYSGRCARCKKSIRIGDPIAYLPPKESRPPVVCHRRCQSQKKQNPRRKPRAQNWRGNADWMNAEDFALLDEAMSKKAA